MAGSLPAEPGSSSGLRWGCKRTIRTGRRSFYTAGALSVCPGLLDRFEDWGLAGRRAGRHGRRPGAQM